MAMEKSISVQGKQTSLKFCGCIVKGSGINSGNIIQSVIIQVKNNAVVRIVKSWECLQTDLEATKSFYQLIISVTK